MKTKILIIVLLVTVYRLLITDYCFAQNNVGINTSGSTPNSSAILDLNTGNTFTSPNGKGLLIPCMNTASMNAIVSPVNGLIIFNTDCETINYYNGTTWIAIGNGSGISAPGAITGSTSPACNATGIPYSIAAVTGATGYNWTVPTGATVATGQGTTATTVNFGAVSGNVCVSASNACGTSAPSCVTVTLPGPAQPSAITGTSPVCQGDNGDAYSVTNVGGVTYTWTYSGTGYTQASGGTTNSITANFSASATSGTLTVTPSNACGSGTPQTLAITVNAVPAAPTAGTNTPSQTQVVWNWNTSSGATAYYYNTVNNFGTATSNGASTSYTQTGLTCNTAYTLYIWAYNSCGNSTATTLTQTTSACCTPSVVTISTLTQTTTCNGTNTIVAWTGYGSTTWTVPTGVTLVNYLVVGGGGAAGTSPPCYHAGGGGGQVLSGTLAVSGSIALTVGAGGTGTSYAGNPGGVSSFSSISASGGQGGLSGGATGGTCGDGVHIGGSGTCNPGGGGGGGGASANGSNAPGGGIGGAGGNGVASSITGSSIYYGGGGEGIGYTVTGNGPGLGSIGGGGFAGSPGSDVGNSGTVIISY